MPSDDQQKPIPITATGLVAVLAAVTTEIVATIHRPKGNAADSLKDIAAGLRLFANDMTSPADAALVLTVAEMLMAAEDSRLG